MSADKETTQVQNNLDPKESWAGTSSQIILKAGFLPIAYANDFDKEKVRKGIKLIESQHVKRVEELSGFENGSKLIKASVIRTTNVNEQLYQVKLEIYGPQRQVIERSCTCIAQASKKCKHIYAVIHYINTYKSLSKTSLEQQWGKPSDRQLGQDQYSYVPPISERFKDKRTDIKYFENVPEHDVNYSHLEKIYCSFKYSKKVESDGLETAIIKSVVNNMLDKVVETYEHSLREASIEFIIYTSCTDVIKCKIQIEDPVIKQFYDENICVDEDKVAKLCHETILQSRCQKWFDVRAMRISASMKAHKIKTRRKKSISQLVDEFFSSPNLDKIEAIEYGRNNERTALNEYCTTFNKLVKLVYLLCLRNHGFVLLQMV